MDKEMLDKISACKTVDEVEALLADRRVLTDAELEQVSGGGLVLGKGEFNIETEEDLNYFIYTFLGSMEKAFGKDITCSVLIDRYIRSNGVKDAYMSAGLDGLHNYLAIRLFDRPAKPGETFY